MESLRRSRTLKRLKKIFHSSKRTSGRQKSLAERWDIVEVSLRCSFAIFKVVILQGYGKPSVFHATVVIFLEFFAWGLLTSPTIQALKVAFPTGTFLKNGIVQGIKVWCIRMLRNFGV